MQTSTRVENGVNRIQRDPEEPWPPFKCGHPSSDHFAPFARSAGEKLGALANRATGTTSGDRDRGRNAFSARRNAVRNQIPFQEFAEAIATWSVHENSAPTSNWTARKSEERVELARKSGLAKRPRGGKSLLRHRSIKDNST